MYIHRNMAMLENKKEDSQWIREIPKGVKAWGLDWPTAQQRAEGPAPIGGCSTKGASGLQGMG